MAAAMAFIPNTNFIVSFDLRRLFVSRFIEAMDLFF
jgi:hypothetical protein